jgi:hypothetical protein
MDTTVSATVGGVVVGLVAGFPAGMLFVSMKRAWSDVATAKKAVPTARKGAWGRTREAIVLCFFLAIGVALAIGAAHSNQ